MGDDSLINRLGIYIVDDLPQICRIIERTVKKLCPDIPTYVFNSASDALESMCSSPPLIVFSDMNMPQGMNGYEFLSKVRELYPEARRAMVSSSKDMMMREMRKSDIIERFVEKPDIGKSITDVLREFLGDLE